MVCDFYEWPLEDARAVGHHKERDEERERHEAEGVLLLDGLDREHEVGLCIVGVEAQPLLTSVTESAEGH